MELRLERMINLKFNKQQWEWIFYDWANSGYAMLVTTAVFPIYFKVVALQGGISSADSTAYWGYANSFSTLIIALLAPLLGALADYPVSYTHLTLPTKA